MESDGIPVQRPQTLLQRITVVGCAVLLLVCSLGLVGLHLWLNAWEQQAEELVNSGNSVAFGDGAHLIAIRTAEALPMGIPTMVGYLRITVVNAGRPQHIHDLDRTAQGWTYWAIEFQLENSSQTETVRVNPQVDSQLQDMTSMPPSYDFGFPTRDPQLLRGVIHLPPQGTLHGTLIYNVREGTSPLFWVYPDTWEKEIAVFRVR